MTNKSVWTMPDNWTIKLTEKEFIACGYATKSQLADVPLSMCFCNARGTVWWKIAGIPTPKGKATVLYCR